MCSLFFMTSPTSTHPYPAPHAPPPRMLGFNRALRAVLSSYSAYGYASGAIWMDDVECTGNETRIDFCSFPGWGIHDCYHWQDAGVICDGEPRPLSGRRGSG